ncbi:tubulin binding cofactor, putative [Theileria annulata]|uniref:Tubulin-specific chaperone A n=1 Tax=Theileria annulata TaxID=5874 RepID=Q4U963_THEAN|nr:tubulin binding cofactor, putative [Theileria annulata]CAI76640.1 tubulin binding cofactor, putative [Theileria annulata]|eukprot:XP_953265.1 tubulin binding cofactor, putative [Theileria annulata]
MEQEQTLHIKKGAIVRTMKEYSLYKKELQEAQSKFESVKATGEEHEVRAAMKILEESSAVLEDSKKRLTMIAMDLDQYMMEMMRTVEDSSDTMTDDTLFLECKSALEDLSRNHPEIEFRRS